MLNTNHTRKKLRVLKAQRSAAKGKLSTLEIFGKGQASAYFVHIIYFICDQKLFSSTKYLQFLPFIGKMKYQVNRSSFYINSVKSKLPGLSCFKVESLKFALGSEWFPVIKHDYLCFPEASKKVSHQFILAQKEGCKVIFTWAREEESISQSLDILLEGKDIFRNAV